MGWGKKKGGRHVFAYRPVLQGYFGYFTRRIATRFAARVWNTALSCDGSTHSAHAKHQSRNFAISATRCGIRLR